MIHPTAVVRSDLPEDVCVGPFALVGEDVQVGKDVSIGHCATVQGPCRLGDGVVVGPSAVIGTDPQDLKYAGERTELIVGARTVIREFANINRGSAATRLTSVGEDCLVMAYVHVAHDCRIGNGVILANAVNLAGHVEIGDHATVGGVVPVHQFVRIGCHSMIGGGFRVAQDVPPYALAGGYPLRVISINSIGLRRRGFDGARLDSLEDAFRILFREPGLLSSKARTLLERDDLTEEVRYLARFVVESSRGLVS
ncbi:acyl-ACP--UDP-N-acetylglucosamine O-acyltransferase [Candidatus Fermentibacterales bacterium]|nr:acyl-ACP--UDP-N-acetylglucosamine O-acyltransferase [Candidatus Fermentibacterales bacterium]